MKHILWLPLLSLVVCIINVPEAHSKSRAAQEDDIREVLLRRLAPNQGTKPKQPATKRSGFEPPEIKVYFFSHWNNGKSKDPSDQFLKRFAGWKPPIKKESQSYVDPNAKDFAWSYVKDKQNQDLGMRFSVGRINWLGKNRVSVSAGYAAGGLNATSATCWLRLKGRHWRITKIEYGPVS